MLRTGPPMGRLFARALRRLAATSSEHRAALLFAVAAAIPVIVACVRAALHGWWPEGDDAIIGLKVSDVFSSHAPLMGMRSTSGFAQPELATHHPGPIEFYLLALPNAIAGSRPIGLLIGTALIGLLTVFTIAVVARRRGGLPLVVAMLAGVIAVAWAVGPETLFRPFNPYPAVLPIFALLLLAWALLRDDLGWMWVYALTASFVAQAHLAYVPFVLVLTGVLAIVGLVRWRRRREAMWPVAGWRPVGQSPRFGPGWRTVVVLAVSWLPVAVETVTYAPNNLSQLLRYATADAPVDRVGLGRAAGLVVRSLAPVPGGFSPLPTEAVNNPMYRGTPILAVIIGLCVLALLVLSGFRTEWAERRRVWNGDRATGSALAVCALVVMCVTVAIAPESPFGSAPRYYVIGVWPVAAFAIGVAGWQLVAMAQTRSARHRAPAAWTDRPGAVGATAAGLAIASVVACASPVPVQWASIDLARRVSEAVAAQIVRVGAQDDAVRLEADGFIGFGSIAASVAYRLRSQGTPVFLSSLWPFPQDDDFRRVEAAPPDATRVLIHESSGAGSSTPPVGVGAPVLTVTVATGTIEVYVERPAPTG